MAQADALISFEGNNEPNNWGVTYQGEKGGGEAPSWMAVAKLQRDMYAAVKGDPLLKKYPVWSVSENGGERDNVGMQFLTIPEGAGALMPAGTKYADCANVHNYIYHQNAPLPVDNKTWNVSDPGPACKVDGLFGNYGHTWGNGFKGYSEAELQTLPRVTTETGCTIDKNVSEEMQGLNLLSLYLDQFKRGWSNTSAYILRDRTDESGNQSFGFYKTDYTPRKAAVFFHNLTTILADKGSLKEPGKVDYSITDEPETMHDMLLQNSDGTMQLVVWNERVTGEDAVIVHLGGKMPTVKVFDPTAGTDAVQTLKDVDAVKLSLGNRPAVIMFAAPR
jgi:hypothetical protein